MTTVAHHRSQIPSTAIAVVVAAALIAAVALLAAAVFGGDLGGSRQGSPTSLTQSGDDPVGYVLSARYPVDALDLSAAGVGVPRVPDPASQALGIVLSSGAGSTASTEYDDALGYLFSSDYPVSD